MGRPVALKGRGGGGIGRPVWLRGGIGRGAPPSPVSPVGRCVGRIVVGPSGDGARTGAGLTGCTLRVRTTFVASGAGVASAATGADGSVVTGLAAWAGTCVTGTVDAGATVTSTTGAGSAFTVLVDFDALAGSSGATSRRRPSASARRRMRSAWASSIEAEGLDAPMPSLEASSSNSLLVSPSSLESSCTRIFFCAKTFPNLSAHDGEHSSLFFHNYGDFEGLSELLPLPYLVTVKTLPKRSLGLLH